MYSARDVGEVLVNTGRLLAFRSVAPDMKRLGPLYIAMGLGFAWLAGIGRYWDNPKAYLWQSLGLGSIAYVFAMALLLWLIIWPLNPRNWRYKNVLVFVALTAPPAILYAIPVERFMTFEGARLTNTWFLATVALWRVILLWLFLRRSAGLGGGTTFVGTFVPITLIIFVLAALNLEHAIFVFEVMGGLAPVERTPNDGAYATVVTISTLSIISFPILLVAYLFLCIRARPSKWDDRTNDQNES